MMVNMLKPVKTLRELWILFKIRLPMECHLENNFILILKN